MPAVNCSFFIELSMRFFLELAFSAEFGLWYPF
jgi:hypothetical protein